MITEQQFSSEQIKQRQVEIDVMMAARNCDEVISRGLDVHTYDPRVVIAAQVDRVRDSLLPDSYLEKKKVAYAKAENHHVHNEFNEEQQVLSDYIKTLASPDAVAAKLRATDLLRAGISDVNVPAFDFLVGANEMIDEDTYSRARTAMADQAYYGYTEPLRKSA